MYHRIQTKILSSLLFLLLFPGCCTGDKIIILPSGLSYIDNKIGTGKGTIPGDTVSIHFIAWLIKDSSDIFNKESNNTNMISLGNSYIGNKPLEFILGTNNFIKGSDEGIAGMKEGGIRTVIIPAGLIYGGEKDKHSAPYSGIKLIVELLSLK